MKNSFLITFGLLLSTLSIAASNESVWTYDSHIRSSSLRKARKKTNLLALPKSLTPGNYKQSIDHFGALPGQTFNQRYWVDTEYAPNPATAPVIYHICGEGDATQGYFLNDNAIEWAKSLGANLVYLEHRYYGQSLPFPDLSTDHLQYLTLDNVMEDLAGFQKWMSTNQKWSGKWITVGGSYSGTLSALYRQKHPELIVGALAASAPMISGTGQAEGTSSDVDQLSSTDPSGDDGGRQWVYQACINFGFWQTDETIIYQPSSWLCQQLFGNVSLVNSTVYNQNYDTPFISNSASAPKNIMFTYGSDDIWTTIGLSQDSNLNPNITIRVINGAGHHYDLNAPTPADNADVIAARQEFLSLAQKWLE